ncbi:hypothetical protein U1Q18_014907 [Sarracenia purpurea var. burkii]
MDRGGRYHGSSSARSGQRWKTLVVAKEDDDDEGDFTFVYEASDGDEVVDSATHMKAMRINVPLLRAAAQMWDPEFHAFRFGHEELCPTVDELLPS